MDEFKKNQRYERLYDQLEKLMETCDVPLARMATISSVLSHKMEYFFWTGFYLLTDGELVVGPYQGPVACMLLEKDKGVCWAGINRNETLIVPDVEQFPGHIACDSRSRSEIVIPLHRPDGEVIGVLDVDSTQLNSFDKTDGTWLNKIVELIYK